MFRHMDLLDLQSLIEADGKYRFELRFDPSKGEEAWWIRAKLWDEKKYTLVPCRLIHGVRTVVYKTTLDEWNNHISRSGIPLLGNDYIQLDRTINTPEYINTLSPHSAIFIFIDAQTALLAGLRFFFLLEISAHVNRHTPLLTRGNHLGLIPPSLFARVSLVEAAKTLIWSRQGTRPLSPAKDTEAHAGSLAAELARFGHRPWPKEDLDVTPLTGRRGTYLPYLGREMHAFADLPGEVFLRGGRTRRGGGAEGGGGEGGGGGGTGVEGGERGERAMGDAEAEEGADTGRPARSAGWSGFLPLDERTVEEAREVLLSASSEAGEAEVDSEGVATSSLSSPSSPSPSPSTASPKTTPPPTPQTLYTPTGLLKPFNPPPGSSVLEVPEPVPSEGSEFEFEYELQSWSGLEGKGKGKGKDLEDLEAGNGAEARGKAGADVKAKSSAEKEEEKARVEDEGQLIHTTHSQSKFIRESRIRTILEGNRTLTPKRRLNTTTTRNTLNANVNANANANLDPNLTPESKPNLTP
ncbi:hypothetical protein CVT26_014947 [Gymnopilus dilepis]|uniref:Uncharacterized protein n=1 Tax=Gymnopilus dilepis TaxID=231916 RepID=A0A409X7A3_9AGAR|nr:hypothetical protein CVT26_014947 [Gymnopilus dilepis]